MNSFRFRSVLKWFSHPNPARPTDPEREYEEAVSAIRALKSLFEGELYRRGGDRNDRTKARD